MRMASVSRLKEPINPFYVLTAVAGVAFTMTACGYGLVDAPRSRAAASSASPSRRRIRKCGTRLMNLLDQHGILILAVEVGILAVASVAAILLDHYRGKRIAARQHDEPRGIA